MRGAWVIFSLAACSAPDEEHPPQYSPDGASSPPRECAEVRQGEAKKGAVWYQGAPAACGATGMECPIFDVAAFAGVCAKGTPVATCQNGRWLVSCDLDAGVLDAAEDG